MKKTNLIVALPLALMLMLAGCSSHDDAVKALKGAGYTDIQTDGYSFFGCSKDDTYHTKFKAKGPTGQPAEGVVCGGVLKGSTIRTD